MSIKGQLSLSVKGRSLKNELNYNRDTWAEWTKSVGVTGDVTGLEFTANGSTSITANLITNLKPSTQYMILYNVVSNTMTVNTYIGSTGGNHILATNALPREVGNHKLLLTTQATFTLNRVQLANSSTEPAGNKIKLEGIRIFECPVGSETETDYNTMTVNQLAQKYPYIKGDSVKSTLSIGNTLRTVNL